MIFKIGEKVIIKDENELHDFWNFIAEHMNADIYEYYINGNDKDPDINEEGVYIDMLWIKPGVTSGENISNIIKVIDYLEKYSNIKFCTIDINVR